MRVEAYYLTDPEGSGFSNKLFITLNNKGHNAQTILLTNTTKTLKFLVKIKISVQVYRCVSTVVIHALCWGDRIGGPHYLLTLT